ncbi:MAG: transposase [Flavobacteriaceae bacterium]|nr:MAG: transposase [Flavobacteriaceae bacterium]QMU66732.1 MAG: transposase [Flavobacteriaceae bacterium]
MGIISEIGADMIQFPDHKHLASWAGMCPGSIKVQEKTKVVELPMVINICVQL